MKESVTIIIKCKADPHVLETIRSIDYPAEVIVSLVRNPVLKASIEARGARVLDAPDNNAGASCQLGIHAASNEACILTDSDTIFGPGYICACLYALDQSDICRGRIQFLHNPSVTDSRIVSKVRDYINNVRRPPYMPGLGLRRSLAIRLGGFDKDICWGVDHEFGVRAFAAGAKYMFLESVYIEHLPISSGHDLRAAFRTGQAMRALDRKAGREPNGFHNGWVKSIVRGIRYEPYLDIMRHGGVACGLHHLKWVQFFYRGYWASLR